jgi:GxxExxY protein
MLAVLGYPAKLRDRRGLRLEHEDREGSEGHEGLSLELERLGRAVVDAGLKVHRTLGPGLLESVYEHCLARELELRGVAARRQVALPITYEGVTLEVGYRLDLVVGDAVIVEIKAVEMLTRLHEAQVLTYLRLSNKRLAFLMNFNVTLFKNGLKRIVL